MAKRKTISRTQPSKGRKSQSGAKRRSPSRKLYTIAKRHEVAGQWFTKLVALQSRLYGPGGCPWDREQTHESLRKYLIEEAYEVLDAMESGDPRKFSGELGDLLLQVVFHSILAEKRGAFTLSDVVESVHSKMIRRHPHVFGDVTAETPAAVLKNWEQIKAEERATERKGLDVPSSTQPAPPTLVFESALAGVPRSLPAVLEAYQLTRRAAHIGFDWDSLSGIFEKIEEEKKEISKTLPKHPINGKQPSPSKHTEEEVGDLLFAAVNVARFLGVDPEIALKKANLKFKNRFTFMEAASFQEGKALVDVKRDQMEKLWDRSKNET